MIDLDAYSAEPEDVPPPEPVRRDDSPVVLRGDPEEAVMRLGCYVVLLAAGFYFGTAILLGVVGLLMGINPKKSFSDLLPHILLWSVVAAFPASPVVYYIISRKNRRAVLRARAASYAQAVRAQAQRHKSEVERKEKEAQALTRQLRDLLKEAFDTRAELSDSLARAACAVEEAEREYAESAFDPYWTAVEEAAEGLAAYASGVRQLSRRASDYYKLLAGRRHNFPAFPVRAETLPDAAPLVAEFRRVVRMGQVHEKFASIWEHRLTRRFTGFRNLGDAVKNLGAEIERSLSSLESATATGPAPAPEGQVGRPEAGTPG